MAGKTAQLQIRVTSEQKRELRRLARGAAMDVSAYVLQRALPDAADRMRAILRRLARSPTPRFELAELNDLLTALTPASFSEAAPRQDVRGLDPFLQNYVAAMIEYASGMKRVTAPSWVNDIEPLEAPFFASTLGKLRLHLLRVTPAAFRRRNLFVDASIGDRV